MKGIHPLWDGFSFIMMGMKEKDFAKILRCFANLYGVILDEDAYQILKGYYPGLKSNEFKKELSLRARHFTKGYSIRPIEGKDAYVIGNDELSDEQYGLILTVGAHYRFKILPLEEFLLYSDKKNLPDASLYKMVACFCEFHSDLEKYPFADRNYYAKWIKDHLLFNGYETIKKLLFEDGIYGFHAKEGMETIYFLHDLAEVNNDTRMYLLRGHAPNDFKVLRHGRPKIDKKESEKPLDQEWEKELLSMEILSDKELTNEEKDDLLKKMDDLGSFKKDDLPKA